MTLDRRTLLTGGAVAIAAVTTIGGMALRTRPPEAALPTGLIPADRNALILHPGDSAAVDFLRALRAGAPNGRVEDHALAVLAPHGFAQTTALLDNARGKALVAWLDDGDAVVVEAMLHARGGTGLTRQRHASRTLLTARI